MGPARTLRSCLAGFLALVGSAFAQAAPPPSTPLEELSLEQLMDVSVYSASRAEEKLLEAPATVIVLTRRDLVDRGYSELSEILDDLPGMDVVRPRGATYLKSYWRGFRNTIGAPYLFLIDGVAFNHLYFNTADVMASVPLSHVERIEVVYGPASSVYGANAFMGVINVVTRSLPDDGTAGRLRVEGGAHDREIAEISFLYRHGPWRLSLAARSDNGDVVAEDGGYEYARDELYADPRLWGGFADGGRLGGQLSSPHRNRGVDLRLFRRDLELAVQYFKVSSGYGVEYSADQAQTRAVWARSDLSAFLRWRRSLGDRLTSTSLLRFRNSDVDDDSYFVEAFEAVDDGGRTVRRVDFSLWSAANESVSLLQDFRLDLGSGVTLLAGLELERKDLQKAYETAFGPALPPSEIDPATYPFPGAGDFAGPARNRITTRDTGAYFQTRWRRGEHHLLHLGLRWDDNSEYGSAVTVRTGYVGTFDRWSAKALFGEGFQEPNPRVLFGGWRGSGSDPDLDPERSRTVELSAGYTGGRIRHLLSVFRVDNRDTIINTGPGTDGNPNNPAGARNLGDRTVTGLDLHVQTLLPHRGLEELRLWAYYSRILDAEEERFDETGQLPDGRIGDLADDKLFFGLTARHRRWTATVRGRYIGERPTVETNPVERVASFVTTDLFLSYRPGRREGLSLGLKVDNLFDEAYFHPGVRDASSGVEPGFFDDDGVWHGSAGFFNSLLPQPGRAVSWRVSFDF